jgi:hypothetical protein
VRVSVSVSVSASVSMSVSKVPCTALPPCGWDVGFRVRSLGFGLWDVRFRVPHPHLAVSVQRLG